MAQVRGTRLLTLSIICLLLLAAACRQDAEETPTTAAAITASPDATVTMAPTETSPPPTATPLPTTTPAPMASPEATEGAFEEASCEFDVPQGRDVRCGYLEVPENRHDEGNDNVVRLHVAIFASDSTNPQPDPIVYLEGGPGGDALESVPFVFEERFAPYLADRELIMFDQRGTGYSEPSLDCPEYKELSLELLDEVLPLEEEERLFLEVMGECHSRLIEEGVDLGAYNSEASAADLDDLRQALGYEEWNLWGISYGTRLALTAMRDYPHGVRSVVLDSTYPPQVNVVTETPPNLARAMDVFFSSCAGDAACDEAYPDLRAAFFDLVAEANETPLSLEVFHALNRQRYEARLAGDDLLGVLFQGLYSEEIIPLLPKFIYDTAAGDYDILSALLANLIVSDEFISIGMNFSVQCQEEVAFATPEEAQAAAEAYPELEAYFEGSATSGQTAFRTCALWDVPAAAPVENEAVHSDIPTLILAGEFDPVTPPSWGFLAEESLSHSTVTTFPGLGHGVSLAGACPRSVVLAFLDDPGAEPAVGCVEALAGPAYVVPGAAEVVEMVPFTTDLFGTELSGLAPEGWEEISTGIFVRQQTAVDQTALLQQAAPGIDSQQFLDLLSSQLGLEEGLEAEGTQEAGGRTWTLYATETQGALVDIALAEDEGVTFVVLLFSHSDERDALVSSVLLPALEAIAIDG